MSFLIDKAAFTAQIHTEISKVIAGAESHPASAATMFQILAGIMAETLLVFDDPDEGYRATVASLSLHLGGAPQQGQLAKGVLSPAFVIDAETEKGRELARRLFEDWMDCPYEFHDLLVFVTAHIISRFSCEAVNRPLLFRLYEEFLRRSLAYEIAAQELCDVVIEEKIGVEGWGLDQSISGLSAVAGRMLGLSRDGCAVFQAPQLPDNLDQVAYVLTQEAVRLGIPAGSDWRFGLAANDYPATAPFDLIFSLWPCCRDLLKTIGLHHDMDQAVAVAKAAGRMLAVAAGGEQPELEPLVAKPLAIAALTDTYRAICQEDDLVKA